jgi:hypothetical protein
MLGATKKEFKILLLRTALITETRKNPGYVFSFIFHTLERDLLTAGHSTNDEQRLFSSDDGFW